jgi:hypothetical protein
LECAKVIPRHIAIAKQVERRREKPGGVKGRISDTRMRGGT